MAERDDPDAVVHEYALSVWGSQGVDDALRAAFENGVAPTGLSAGAAAQLVGSRRGALDPWRAC